MEHRVFPTLLKFYREISGRYMHHQAAAEMICRDLGVCLKGSTELGPLEGKLYFYGRKEEVKKAEATVHAASHTDPEHRGLVIYHELAHWRLGIEIPFLARRGSRGYPRSIDIKMEYWCDAFATAMLFAWAGVEVLKKGGHQEFFAGGTSDRRSLVGKGRERKRDMYCGFRIHCLNQKHFKSPCLGFTVLANDLLDEGTEKAAT